MGSFYITANDELWAISKQGYIGKLDRRTQAFEYVVEEQSQTPVHIEHASTLYVSVSHQIALVGTVDQGIKLVQLSDGNTQELIKPEKRQPMYARSIQPMQDDEIWIATFNGIYIYHLTTQTITHLAQEKGNYYSLSSNAIKRFYKDREGGIWICTDNGGINYLPPYLNFHKDYDIPGTDGIKGEVIHDLLQDPSGRIWIGTEDAGLNLFDPHTHTYKLFQEHEGLSQNCIHGLAYLNNQLWVGTLSNGIDVIDLSSQRIIEHYNIKTPSASNATIVYLYTTRQQQLYAATANGVYRFEDARKRFEKYPYFPDNCRIQTLFEDQEGVLWAGTFHNGLYYCDPNTGNRGKLTLNVQHTSDDLTINHLYEDAERRLWIASGSGLLIYDRQLQATTKLTADDGLPSNVIYRIEPDKADRCRLWLSTANGLVSIHRTSQSMMVYKREHGLLSNQFNFNSSLCAKEGKLYFGCLKGLVSFYPNQIKGYAMQPTVYLTTLYYVNPNENTRRHKPITFKKSIELRHDQSSFTIEYTSFCYQAPHLIPYAYRLVGLEENWHHTVGHTHANYNKLRPGKYVFQVKAANLSGTWNEQFVIDFMNDGQPISPELKDKIFEPFYRIASSAHKPGSGLGLPFARLLAKKHGGTLACEEMRDGTILFRLTLPNRQTTPEETDIEQPQAIEARQSLTDPQLNPKKDCPHILVVEDNAEMAQFIAEELSYTYNITIAYNGVEALEQLREQSIQLIISDVMMPVMDGLTLLKTIRKDHQLCHIPFILLTAKCTEQTHMEGLEYGADAYFEKPFSIHLLTKQVAKGTSCMAVSSPRVQAVENIITAQSGIINRCFIITTV